MSEPEKESESKVQRASERKRAYRIRQKPESDRTDAEREWFAIYESTKQRRGAQTDPEVAEPEVQVTEESPVQPQELPPLPPPPAPPRVEVRTPHSEESDTEGADWRRKYRAKTGGKAGRERTVIAVASQWKAALVMMAEQIRMSGGVPLMDVEEMWPHLVVTVDDILPEKITLKSSHIAAVGTTVLLVQRVVRNKAVGEAYARGVQPEEPAPRTQPQDYQSPAPVPAPEPAPEPIDSVPMAVEPLIRMDAAPPPVDTGNPGMVY